MKKSLVIASVLVGMMAVGVMIARAGPKEVTVGFLQAAVSSLADQDEVTLTAVFPGVASLKDSAHGRSLRGDGYSRFAVKDPQARTTFESMYVLQHSRVFPQLLSITGPHRVSFRGYKEEGEDNEEAIFVTSVDDLGPVKPAASDVKTESAPGVSPTVSPSAPPRAFRVTITDNVTSNRTLIINIVTNRPYTVNGTTVVIEEEPQ